eukprot:11298734-Ditylum_brightwellii.AAC.1
MSTKALIAILICVSCVSLAHWLTLVHTYAHCWRPGASLLLAASTHPCSNVNMLPTRACDGLMPTLGEWVGSLASTAIFNSCTKVWGSGLWACRRVGSSVPPLEIKKTHLGKMMKNPSTIKTCWMEEGSSGQKTSTLLMAPLELGAWRLVARYNG